MRQIGLAALFTLAAWTAQAQTYPHYINDLGQQITPNPAAGTGIDSVTNLPCPLGGAITCKLQVSSSGGGGGPVTAVSGAYALGSIVDLGTGASPGANTVNGRLSTLNVTLGSPFQAGGSIGNTAFIANAGTNLNTSALALETGGNLANIYAAQGNGSSPAANTTNNYLQTLANAVNSPIPSGTNAIGSLIANPATSNNGSTTITTGNTFQTLLALNAARKGCLIQNPYDATETLYISVGVATGSATKAKSYQLTPGATFSCNSAPYVITDNIAVTAVTSGHAFVETDQ